MMNKNLESLLVFLVENMFPSEKDVLLRPMWAKATCIWEVDNTTSQDNLRRVDKLPVARCLSGLRTAYILEGC